jgi:hypothetical protein
VSDRPQGPLPGRAAGPAAPTSSGAAAHPRVAAATRWSGGRE